jgi:uncharacterized protein (DUF58 family)
MQRGVFTAEAAERWRTASTPTFLSRLDRLRIDVRGKTGRHPGNNPVSWATQDGGLDFAKHRPYLPGDDLRHIDWNAMARLETKLVKTFRAEREAPLHILVDCSASMGTPPEDMKFNAATALASSLAYISLRHRDPVRVAIMQDGRSIQVGPLLRHPNRVHLVPDSLSLHIPVGTTDLLRSVESYLHLTRLPGVVIVISDFLVPPANYEPALRRLLAGGYAVAAIRVTGIRQREPTAPTRRVRLFDVETRRHRVINLTDSHRTQYTRALEKHDRALRTWCAANGLAFCTVDTIQDPCAVMTTDLPRAGILR